MLKKLPKTVSKEFPGELQLCVSLEQAGPELMGHDTEKVTGFLQKCTACSCRLC